MKHSNVAIFIPHSGCENTCSFCNQKTISGQTQMPALQDIHAALEQASAELGENTRNAEIAFFGGSFTCLSKEQMEMLLKTAYSYVKGKYFKGIRISTRPDAINRDILALLQKYGVTAIELGAQSMSDKVLEANRRGHTVQDIVDACAQITAFGGFELGLQMMTGLYKSNREEDMNTASALLNCKPDTLRVYPTVVLRGTYLCELYEQGRYIPMTLDETVSLCASILEACEQAGVRVIKMGLHSSLTVERDMAAGVYHPAFRELVEGERMYQKAMTLLEKNEGNTICVSPKSLSKMIGQKRKNLMRLQERYKDITIITDASLRPDEIRIT